jgi:Site-specific recombinases, DNA invertase Pin homologs
MSELRAAIYCRVAYADQLAVELQEETLRRYAADHGFGDPSCYADNGFSGLRLDNRPAFDRLNAAIDAGEIGVVIVRNHARIGRNFLEVDAWIDRLAEKGVRFITTDYPYEPVPVFPVDLMAAMRRESRKARKKKY